MAGSSNHWDVMVILKATIDALALTGLTGGTLIQEVANFQDGQAGIPFISISPYGSEEMIEPDGLQDVDATGYPTAVIIMGENDTSLLEQRLAWRQTIRRNFNNTTPGALITKYSLGLANPVRVYNLNVRPGNIVEPNTAFDRKGFISGMLVIAKSQEPRS